jgi:hypothetical protein
VVVPLTVGKPVLLGAGGGTAATDAVAAEAAEPEPPEFVAVTTTRMV